MPQFRKKPVVVEAEQFAGMHSVPAIHRLTQVPVCTYNHPAGTLSVYTLEGVMTASPGDWIIRGVKGELYPCKPDVFAATYEAV